MLLPIATLARNTYDKRVVVLVWSTCILLLIHRRRGQQSCASACLRMFVAYESRVHGQLYYDTTGFVTRPSSAILTV